MSRNILIALILVAGTMGFLFMQSQRAKEAARAQEEDEQRKKLELLAKQAREGKVNVLKANVALPANTRVPETAVRSELISKDLAPQNSQLRLEDVVDKFTTETIPKDDIVNKNRLTDVARNLESFLQEGERFYSIRADGVNAVSGYVKQGDHVDVVAVMIYGTTQICRTVLSNLEIFSVNQYHWEMTADEKKKGDLGGLTLTFKLSGDQASRLIQLLQLGVVPRFMLRPPSDIDPTITTGWTLDQVVNDEDPKHPKGPVLPPRKEGEPPPMLAIQVIRYTNISTEMFPITTPVAEAYAADIAPLPSGGVQPGGPKLPAGPVKVPGSPGASVIQGAPVAPGAVARGTILAPATPQAPPTIPTAVPTGPPISPPPPATAPKPAAAPRAGQ